MTSAETSLAEVAVVIPCFRAAKTVERVVREVPGEVWLIVCVDDASDDGTDEVLRRLTKRDKRVEVITHADNQGVGGATITGYRRAIECGAKVIVKIDSDGQMNPAFIPAFVEPILRGQGDYVKGNRFFDVDLVLSMPKARLIGNAGLSFVSKLSTGYWDLLDPTNGYTAIHADVAELLPMDKLHKRYFFESDILFRLGSFGARIVEQPMETRYRGETSHLNIGRALVTFPFLHMRNFMKRIFYNYFLRDFDVATLDLIGGVALVLFGLIFGAKEWLASASSGIPATAGTVMLSVTPLLVGIQLLLAFLQHDVARTPRNAIHPRILRRKVLVTRQIETDRKHDDPRVQSHSETA